MEVAERNILYFCGYPYSFFFAQYFVFMLCMCESVYLWNLTGLFLFLFFVKQILVRFNMVFSFVGLLLNGKVLIMIQFSFPNICQNALSDPYRKK